MTPKAWYRDPVRDSKAPAQPAARPACGRCRKAGDAPAEQGPLMTSLVLDRFHPAVRAWFESAFAAPTPAQVEAWPAIQAGHHALVAAPTLG